MQSSSFTLDTADGVPVHVQRWLPDEGTAVRAVVQIVHGLAEHVGRYSHVAELLTTAGYAVYGDDHRGHGRTAVSDEDLGFLAEHRGWATLVDDLHRLMGRIREEHPGVPLIMFGHSMGSFLTQQLLFTFPGEIDAAVLSGTSGSAGGPLAEAGALAARIERARLGPRGRSPLLTKLSFGSYNDAFQPARTAFDWLSSDPAAVDAYVADPRCGFDATTQLWLDLLAGVRVIARPELQARIPSELPIHVIAGDRDPVGDDTRGVTALLEAYAAAGLTRVTHRVYPGRHELVNEVNRDEVLADLLAWLDDRVAERTNG